MRILVTNDDGIYSPGIAALAAAASKLGEVRVVAPDVEQSSQGHAVTHSRPLRYLHTPRVHEHAYRVNGTPADCVALGCFHWDHVDVVVSGVNLGVNLGNSLWHSGTVAAARQAALLGFPGIALSAVQDRSGEPEFDRIAPYLDEVLECLVDDPLALVNVNFPRDPSGVRWTRQSIRRYDGQIVPGRDPRGREHFWFTVVPRDEPDEGTDRWALEHGFVSMTPLRIDLTDGDALDRASSTFAATNGGPREKEPELEDRDPLYQN